MSSSNTKKLVFVGAAMLALGGLVGAVGNGLLGYAVNFDQQAGDPVLHPFQVRIDGLDGVLNTQIELVSTWTSWTELVATGTGRVPRTEYTPIVVSRKYKGDDDLTAWAVETKNGSTVHRDITITMMDSAFRELRTVTIDEAIPTHRSVDRDTGIESFDFEFARARE